MDYLSDNLPCFEIFVSFTIKVLKPGSSIHNNVTLPPTDRRLRLWQLISGADTTVTVSGMVTIHGKCASNYKYK